MPDLDTIIDGLEYHQKSANRGKILISANKDGDGFVLITAEESKVLWVADHAEQSDAEYAVLLNNYAPEILKAAKASRRYEKVLKLISVVDQGCGGTLTFEEMAKSAMEQAKAILNEVRQESKSL